MTAATGIVPGTELTSRRTVAAEDVATVARITGDEGMHHVSGLAGRQVAQGLLTVAFAPLLKTEGGFRLDTAEVTFLAPVFVGDEVSCAVTVSTLVSSVPGTMPVAAVIALPLLPSRPVRRRGRRPGWCH